MALRSLGLTLAASLMASACIGTSPEQDRRSDLGPGFDGDEEHRPGQPCTACHAKDYHPGGRVFVVAGTVYRSASDPDTQGLENAVVSILDDAGHEFKARTNRAGNFMVEVNLTLDAPRQRTPGRLQIPWEPVFPLEIGVVVGTQEKAMDSRVWRAADCATCHRSSQTGADHVEKVWFTQGPI